MEQKQITTKEHADSVVVQLKARKLDIERELKVIEFQMGYWSGQSALLTQQQAKTSSEKRE